MAISRLARLLMRFPGRGAASMNDRMVAPAANVTATSLDTSPPPCLPLGHSLTNAVAAATAAATAGTAASPPFSSHGEHVLAPGALRPRKSPTDGVPPVLMGGRPDRWAGGAAPPPLVLLHSCDRYLAVDKPADVRVDGDWPVTVEKMVMAHLAVARPAVLDAGLKRPKLVHQLDFATSGVLLLGLDRPAAAAAAAAFASRSVRKLYMALVDGEVRLPSGPGGAGALVCDQAVAPLGGGDFRMVAVGNGAAAVNAKPARTLVIPLSTGWLGGRRVSRLGLVPHTGRRHQLRVHLAAMRHPIVGDSTYNTVDGGRGGVVTGPSTGPGDGDAAALANSAAGAATTGSDVPLAATPPYRMMLHAWRLRIGGLPLPLGCLDLSTADPFAGLLTDEVVAEGGAARMEAELGRPVSDAEAAAAARNNKRNRGRRGSRHPAPAGGVIGEDDDT